MWRYAGPPHRGLQPADLRTPLRADQGALGGLAYLRAALETIGEAPSYQLEVEADDERLSLSAQALIVAKGSYAGGLKLVDAAVVDDHLLDLALVSAERLADKLQLVSQLSLGRLLESEHVIYRRVARLTLRSDPPLPLRGDGEEVGTSPATLEILPGALQILIPS